MSKDGLKPIGEIVKDALSGLPAPVKELRDASPQALHHFTQADQVNQLVSASEADPALGFMARTMALCSLPRTNPGNRKEYKRVNGPFTLIMFSSSASKLPFGNLPRLLLAWARPRLDGQERRTRTVGVRVTAAEAAELRLGEGSLDKPPQGVCQPCLRLAVLIVRLKRPSEFQAVFPTLSRCVNEASEAGTRRRGEFVGAFLREGRYASTELRGAHVTAPARRQLHRPVRRPTRREKFMPADKAAAGTGRTAVSMLPAKGGGQAHNRGLSR